MVVLDCGIKHTYNDHHCGEIILEAVSAFVQAGWRSAEANIDVFGVLENQNISYAERRPMNGVVRAGKLAVAISSDGSI